MTTMMMGDIYERCKTIDWSRYDDYHSDREDGPDYDVNVSTSLTKAQVEKYLKDSTTKKGYFIVKTGRREDGEIKIITHIPGEPVTNGFGRETGEYWE